MDISHYGTFASIFYFPEEDYAEKINECQRILDEKYPEIAEQFQPFREFVESTPAAELEKIYIRTFDIQALCCMDVGYVLFGEDYTRGKILANLNKEHKEAGVDCKGELADRLSNVLTLLSLSKDEELVEELVIYILKPALKKMVAEFVPNRMKQKEGIYKRFHKIVLSKDADHVTKYRIPISVIQQIMDIDFPELEMVEIGGKKDYMESVKGEMKNSLKANKF